MTNNETYCNLKDFELSCINVHLYLSLMVCIFGSVANVLNICVLTTKNMRIPTNFILTGLAVADLLVMLEYLPFALSVYLHPILQKPENFTKAKAYFLYFHAVFSQICHFISCCLTVLLAVWRYIAIKHPQENKVLCSAGRTKFAIAMSYILCPLVCTPVIINLTIQSLPKGIDTNGNLIPYNMINITEAVRNTTIYTVAVKDKYWQLNMLFYSVIIKLLPCVFLTVLSTFLIKAILNAKNRYKDLCKSSGMPLVNGETKKQRNLEKEQQADRTTRMLLAVLLLFLLTEFPQAILGAVAIILGNGFLVSCYKPLGHLMDMAALTNSAINFILYCTMSQQFRAAFSEVFLPKCIKDRNAKREATTENSKTGKISVV